MYCNAIRNLTVSRIKTFKLCGTQSIIEIHANTISFCNIRLRKASLTWIRCKRYEAIHLCLLKCWDPTLSRTRSADLSMHTGLFFFKAPFLPWFLQNISISDTWQIWPDSDHLMNRRRWRQAHILKHRIIICSLYSAHRQVVIFRARCLLNYLGNGNAGISTVSQTRRYSSAKCITRLITSKTVWSNKCWNDKIWPWTNLGVWECEAGGRFIYGSIGQNDSLWTRLWNGARQLYFNIVAGIWPFHKFRHLNSMGLALTANLSPFFQSISLRTAHPWTWLNYLAAFARQFNFNVVMLESHHLKFRHLISVIEAVNLPMAPLI